MPLLFPNAVEAEASLGCNLTRCNSSACFCGVRSCEPCPSAGLWGGDEVGDPQNVPVWGSLAAGWEWVVGVYGDDYVHGGSQMWRPGGLSLSGFPVLSKEVGTLGCCDWKGRAGSS